MAKPAISQKKILRELRRISENIPAELLQNLLVKETIAPTTKKLFEKAIALPDGEQGMTPAKRRRFENLIRSGVLDKEIDVVNVDAETAISKYFEAELALAVKLGRLPKDAPMPDFIRKKGLQYARRQSARLKELFSAEEGTEAGTSSDDREDAARHSEAGSDDRVLPPPAG